MDAHTENDMAVDNPPREDVDRPKDSDVQPEQPQGSSHPRPIGWSLQDEEYESDPGESPSEGSDAMVDDADDDAPLEGGDDAVTDPLGRVRDCLKGSSRDFIFAMGGSVQLAPDWDTAFAKTTQEPTATTPPSRPPVTLRWDPHDKTTPAPLCKLTFPPDPTSSGNIDQLLRDMEPATFGLGGEDVYDESYRKALKMDPSRFSINFCPSDSGIIDAASRVLLQGSEAAGKRFLQAELYKLNVYTGPSGHFHSHVDTPRSPAQIGSLVVSLPLEHEGGELILRHEGKEMTFDWSGKDLSTIRWAAFYSDCEHEVLEVKSGHRITLTYNLFVTRSTTDCHSSMDPTQLPLYQHMSNVLRDEAFLPNGGYLGFYTSHAYPHTTMTGCLVDALKGLDMAVWTAFQALGCGVCLRPVIKNKYPMNRSFDSSEDFGSELVDDSYIIGSRLELHDSGVMVESYQDWEIMLEYWGLEKIQWAKVTWLNSPNENRQVQLIYAAYGNEATTDTVYSECAILVGVPPFKDEKRMALVQTFEVGDDEDWEKRGPYDEEP